ncbi:MAG: zeta toxin family protein [Helicobacteraceae bacterium]|jgi:predicted ABC-type ATPase|nr:zeta toxin family protein [Helicobacteraceae bacterium]
MANKPQLIVIAGPNGAGKSTLAEHFILRKIIIINPDVIAKEYSLSPLEAGKIAIRQRKEMLVRRKSFAIETTLTGNGEIGLMEEAKKIGYKVNLAYIGIDDVSLSRTRVKIRVAKGGHNVPNEDITRRYKRSINNLAKAFGIADRAYILDNSAVKRDLLYIKNDRIEKQIKSNLPKWAEKSIREIKELNKNDRKARDFGCGL